MCIDEYDFILKQESFKNELAFVSRALGVNIQIDPKYEDSPSVDFIQNEFLQMLERLYYQSRLYYYTDFVLFNYTVDRFIASNDDFDTCPSFPGLEGHGRENLFLISIVNFARLIYSHNRFIFETGVEPTWSSGYYFVLFHFIWDSMSFLKEVAEIIIF